MGRLTSRVDRINGFKFELEFDTGADPNENWVCWINKDTEFSCSRWFKNKSFNDRYYNNFIKKFANNDKYREECIENKKVYISSI